jgi:hypothetical protein
VGVRAAEQRPLPARINRCPEACGSRDDLLCPDRDICSVTKQGSILSRNVRVFHMGASVLKRLLIVLVAMAFIGANLPVSCFGPTTMHDSAAMTAPMDDPCPDCSGDGPTTELAKMTCGALACAGIVGLPTRQVTMIPAFGECVHASSGVDGMAGISLKPDPFPPRPTDRV